MARHRIFRFQVEVTFSDAEEPAPIQDRISRLLQDTVYEETERILDRFFPDTTLLQVDRLEVNLGSVFLEELEQEFPRRFTEAFVEALLATIIVEEGSSDQSGYAPIYSSELERLEIFLSNGSFPWWKGKLSVDSPGRLLRILAETEEQALSDSMRRIGKKPHVRNRKVLSFSDKELHLLIKILEPVSHPFIFEYETQVSRLHRREPLVPLGQSDFRYTHWNLILKYLYEDRGSVFNQKSFVKQLLWQMAAATKTGYHSLISQLALVANDVRTKSGSENPFVRILQEEFLAGVSAVSTPTMLERKLLRDKRFQPLERSVIEALLDGKGNLPSIQELGKSNWQQLATALQNTDSGTLRSMIVQLGRIGIKGQAYINAMPQNLIMSIWQQIYPEDVANWEVLSMVIANMHTQTGGRITPAFLSQIQKKSCLGQLLSNRNAWQGDLEKWRRILLRLANFNNISVDKWLALLLNTWDQHSFHVVRFQGFRELIEEIASIEKLKYIAEEGRWLTQPEAIRQPKAIELNHDIQPNVGKTELTTFPYLAAMRQFENWDGKSIPDWKILEKLLAWSQTEERAFRQWLGTQMKKPIFIDKQVTKLPVELTVAWLDTWVHGLGLAVRGLEELLGELGLWRAFPSLGGGTFWQLVWLQLETDVRQAWSPDRLIKELTQVLNTQSSGGLSKLLEAYRKRTWNSQSTYPAFLPSLLEISLQSSKKENSFTPHQWDIVMVLDQVQRRQGSATGILIPEDLQAFLVMGLTTDRGSQTNQKAYLKQLLAQWATARGMIYFDLLKSLHSLLGKLAPAFRDRESLGIMRSVIVEELGEETVLSLPLESPSIYTSGSDSPESGEKMPGRKLWDTDPEKPNFSDIWIVPNAGLVLLWPYLNTLFERAGLMEGGAFVDETARHKAVYLSDYLVRGENHRREYDLVLNKVLCAQPMALPLKAELEITESLTELCQGLLQAVIGYWSILGETSISSFRETFLMREGSLKRSEKGWHLEVIEESYDILLSQLPWGISTVNLSWMDEVMLVEWG